VTADGKRAIYLAAVNQIALVSNPGRGAKLNPSSSTYLY
jgi:hypothetical protein